SMAQSIDDCHTAYFTPEQFRLHQEWMSGQMQFGGIGASLRKPKTSDPLVIWRVFSGTPADKAGLKDGDVIAEVDGQSVSTMTVQTVVDLIRGPIDRTVRCQRQPAFDYGRSSADSAAERRVSDARGEDRLPPDIWFPVESGQSDQGRARRARQSGRGESGRRRARQRRWRTGCR